MSAAPAAGLVLVKLGGSLLTDKRAEARARPEVIERLAAEVAAARPEMSEGLVLGHGSGSFGHVAAARHGLRGLGRSLEEPPARPAARGVAETQREAARLHRRLLEALLSAGEAPFSWAPSSAMTARAGRPVRLALEPLLGALELGLVPVVYGDVVADRAWGAAICSTETVLLALVRRLHRRQRQGRGPRVRRLLWLGETDGVYDRQGKTVERIDLGSFRRLRREVGTAAGTDVTGGMLHRLETAAALARLGIESRIVNGLVPGLLRSALLGREVPGSRFAALTS